MAKLFTDSLTDYQPFVFLMFSGVYEKNAGSKLINFYNRSLFESKKSLLRVAFILFLNHFNTLLRFFTPQKHK